MGVLSHFVSAYRLSVSQDSSVEVWMKPKETGCWRASSYESVCLSFESLWVKNTVRESTSSHFHVEERKRPELSGCLTWLCYVNKISLVKAAAAAAAEVNNTEHCLMSNGMYRKSRQSERALVPHLHRTDFSANLPNYRGNGDTRSTYLCHLAGSCSHPAILPRLLFIPFSSSVNISLLFSPCPCLFDGLLTRLTSIDMAVWARNNIPPLIKSIWSALIKKKNVGFVTKHPERYQDRFLISG